MFQVGDLIWSDLCQFLCGYIKKLLPDNRAIVSIKGATKISERRSMIINLEYWHKPKSKGEEIK